MNASLLTDRNWFVLYTRPRFEKKIESQLCGETIECFLPLREEVHQWADRKKRVQVPLFASYIFVRVNERERLRALQCDGAMKYVGFGGKISTVRDETIESLRLADTRRDDVRVEERYIEAGTAVAVVRGPLKGVSGILLEHRGRTRVAIQIEAIRQLVSIEVPLADLSMPIEHATRLSLETTTTG